MQPETGLSDSPRLEEALRAAQTGDVEAFNVLVAAFERLVFNVCFRTLGNAEDAADTTQDALLHAFRAIKSFSGPLPGLRAWLLRIAVNACYDHLRRRRRRPAESLEALGSGEPDQDGSPAERLPDPGPGPEQRSLSAETARAIQAALDRLPADQRLTVVLCDVQGLSYDEAAQVMAVELGTVKSRLSRGRARLRELLASQREPPPQARRLENWNP